MKRSILNIGSAALLTYLALGSVTVFADSKQPTEPNPDIINATKGLSGFLNDQKDAKDTVKEINKDEAFKKLLSNPDVVNATKGLGDFLNDQKDAKDTVKEIEDHEAIVNATKGLSDFLDSQKDAKDTVKEIEDHEAIINATKGLSDFLNDQKDAKNTVKEIEDHEAIVNATKGLGDFLDSQKDAKDTVKEIKDQETIKKSTPVLNISESTQSTQKVESTKKLSESSNKDIPTKQVTSFTKSKQSTLPQTGMASNLALLGIGTFLAAAGMVFSYKKMQ